MSSPSKSNSQTASSGSSGSPRRSSNSGMFANLSGYKRDPANPAFQARRASVADQATQKSSVIGGLFNKFVRGEHPAGNK